MAARSDEPVVWETHDLRFTISGPDFDPVITILADHTDDDSAIAQRASKTLLDANDFVPLNEAGFQWMAGVIRLAWSEARVAALVGQLGKQANDALAKVAVDALVRSTRQERDVALQSFRDMEERVAELESGIRRLYELRHLIDAARDNPSCYGGYQGATLYSESFEDLTVELVGHQPDPTESARDDSDDGCHYITPPHGRDAVCNRCGRRERESFPGVSRCPGADGNPKP